MKLLIVALLLSGCSLFSNYEEDYSSKYLTGKNIEGISSDTLEHKLSKTISMNGGQYKVRITPLSKSLIEQRAREDFYAQSLKSELATKMIENKIDQLTSDKLCFDVAIDITRFTKVRDLKEWKIFLRDSKKNKIELTWLDKNNWKEPVLSMKKSPTGAIENWYNKGTACVFNAPINLSEGFSIIARPSIVQWPFNDESEAEWVFNQVKVIDGKKVEVRKKKNSYQKYRGF